jgi:hypothetical protein
VISAAPDQHEEDIVALLESRRGAKEIFDLPIALVDLARVYNESLVGWQPERRASITRGYAQGPHELGVDALVQAKQPLRPNSLLDG